MNGDATSAADAENHKPAAGKANIDATNAGSKTRQVVRRKGRRRLRAAAQRHQQKPERSGPPTAASGTKPALGAESTGSLLALTLHHLKQDSKKEVISRFVLGKHPQSARSAAAASLRPCPQL